MVYELEAAGGNSKISTDWKKSRWAFLLRLTLVIEKLKTHRLRSFVSLLKTHGKTDGLQQTTNKASNTVRRTTGSTGKELILGSAVSCAAPKTEK